MDSIREELKLKLYSELSFESEIEVLPKLHLELNIELFLVIYNELSFEFSNEINQTITNG